MDNNIGVIRTLCMTLNPKYIIKRVFLLAVKCYIEQQLYYTAKFYMI